MAYNQKFKRRYAIYKIELDNNNKIIRAGKKYQGNKWLDEIPAQVIRYMTDPFFCREPTGTFDVGRHGWRGVYVSIPNDVPNEPFHKLENRRVFRKDLISHRNPRGSEYVQKIIDIVDHRPKEERKWVHQPYRMRSGN